MQETADAKLVYQSLRRAIDLIGSALGERPELVAERDSAVNDLAEAVLAARGAAGDLTLLIALLMEKAASDGIDMTSHSFQGLAD